MNNPPRSNIHYRRDLDHFISRYGHANRQIESEKSSLEKSEFHEADVLAAQSVIQQVAETVQQKAHRQIASVVSRCLETVFGDDAYKFKIIFEQKRGKTEARLAFARDDMELDPTSATGGGVIDVAAFALRLACLVLAQPRRRRFLCLDEPFRFVSTDYIPAVKEMILKLAKEMKVQFLIVTHVGGLRVGRVLELE